MNTETLDKECTNQLMAFSVKLIECTEHISIKAEVALFFKSKTEWFIVNAEDLKTAWQVLVYLLY